MIGALPAERAWKQAAAELVRIMRPLPLMSLDAMLSYDAVNQL
jgi:hypothetical protein